MKVTRYHSMGAGSLSFGLQAVFWNRPLVSGMIAINSASTRRHLRTGLFAESNVILERGRWMVTEPLGPQPVGRPGMLLVTTSLVLA
jgi:hypothetical protein